MKQNIQRSSLVLTALVAGLVLKLVSPIPAQSFKTLYNFTPSDSNGANSDGAGPGALILSDNTLYGVAGGGGASGWGTVFSLNTDGTGFRTLYNFTGISNPWHTNSDGASPTGSLVLSSNTLFGAAYQGGSGGNGTLFAIGTDGTGLTVLYSFTSGSSCCPVVNGDGRGPRSPLILAGTTLYGAACAGGSADEGTIFTFNSEGTGFTTLYNFTPVDSNADNSDGIGPGPLILSSNTLYGTACCGGSSGEGTVFAVNTDGTGFTTLHSFEQGTPNADGATPNAPLILSDNTLYGTTTFGGSGGNGTVFKLNTDGTGFVALHSFTVTATRYTPNPDGANPQAPLILSGNTLYGTTTQGGSGGNGTVFEINTDGSGLAVLHSFADISGPYGTNTGGTRPTSPLILSRNTLFGTTGGGSAGNGTIFAISLPSTAPELRITTAAANVILSWPTNATGFTLQSTTNLGSSAVWTTNSAVPVIVNGQNTVTNPMAGRQQFYRLAQ